MSLSCPFLFKTTYNQTLKLCLQKVSKKQTACFSGVFPFKSPSYTKCIHTFFFSFHSSFQKFILLRSAHIWTGTRPLKHGQKRPQAWLYSFSICPYLWGSGFCGTEGGMPSYQLWALLFLTTSFQPWVLCPDSSDSISWACVAIFPRSILPGVDHTVYIPLGQQGSSEAAVCRGVENRLTYVLVCSHICSEAPILKNGV